ncbi:MAG: DNA mismatch repair protein MutL, partial [Planctomycetes bacterium]|nr:DNA mismatch repair protein MutL [Planctomycetota bacterium]
ETPDGLNIIDQHALHERILHEEIGKKIRESKLPSQQLLVPEMVELSPKEFFAALSLKADLARFGVEIEEFGQKTIVVRSFPPILKDCKPQDLLREVLDELADKEAGKSAESRLDKLIEIMACKAAVKSGKHLTPPEIRALLERRDQLASAATCPHGRPTTLTFSKTDLEKQFKRR